MKKSLPLLFYLAVLVGNAQELQKTPPNFGQKKGNLLFLTNRLQQTMAYGGTSNMAGNFGINYDFNYKRVL
jgi:hypothetical protein